MIDPVQILILTRSTTSSIVYIATMTSDSIRLNNNSMLYTTTLHLHLQQQQHRVNKSANLLRISQPPNGKVHKLSNMRSIKTADSFYYTSIFFFHPLLLQTPKTTVSFCPDPTITVITCGELRILDRRKRGTIAVIGLHK